jgi:hypothetical protein
MSFLTIYRQPKREIFEINETLLHLKENSFTKLISFDLTQPLSHEVIDDLFLNLGVKSQGFSLDCQETITVTKCV